MELPSQSVKAYQSHEHIKAGCIAFQCKL